MDEHTAVAGASRSEQIENLLEEYDGWRAIVDRGGDDYDLSEKAVALYRFAITNQDRDGADLLNEALAVFAAAKRED